jgi:hypothetical protein
MDGTIGSYETELSVPNLQKQPVKLSSVVVGTAFQPVSKADDRNPLVHDGRELVPSVTHVVTAGQHLYFYYEVYDPAATPSVKLVTSIAFFRGRVRAFETPPVEATKFTTADRKTVVFQFDVSAASLPPGSYTCQINVIDDTAGQFAFPRLPLFVRK